jgi:hypothetical protein
MPKPKKTKPKRRKGTPGPEGERLIISGDPQEAIAKLLRKKPEGR